MNSWPDAFCETNGIAMHYRTTRVGNPTVVALHGLLASGACWTEIAEHLQGEYNVVMPDFRGHGESSAPDCGYQYVDHAADIAGLLKNLAIKPVLMGHSMGALVAAVTASRYPDQIRGVILADPTFISLDEQRKVRDSDVADQHRTLLSKSLEELIEDLKTRHPHRSPRTIERLARARLNTRMSAFDVLTPPNPDYQELMKSIKVPCLLIRGDSGIVSSALASDLQAISSTIQCVEIKDAGHGVFYDQPDRFSEAVQYFLQSINHSA